MMMEVKTASAKTTMKLQKGCEAMLWKDCEANTVSSSGDRTVNHLSDDNGDALEGY
jgi:hypothetical protein